MNLISISDLTTKEVFRLFEYADAVESASRAQLQNLLKHKTVSLMFFEESTRTRISFELAAKRLGADVFAFDEKASSLTKKGESLEDTIRNLDAMGVDLYVARHPEDGAVARIAETTNSVVINAGDGRREHPTQALFDAYTIRAHRGDNFEGLTVAIVGDVNQRVARSNVALLTMLGARVLLTGPSWWMPEDITGWALGPGSVEVVETIDDAIAKADVLYMLRAQLERATSFESLTETEYHEKYGLTEERAHGLAPNALVMAAGPINRGLELSNKAADGPNSVILEQVTHGVSMRMSIMATLLGVELA